MERPHRFHDELKRKLNTYVHAVYRETRGFPREELYGATSQLRRSALSIMLNYVEGFARQRTKAYRNFLEISYGSLKESRYLLEFAFEEGWMEKDILEDLVVKADEIGAMIWSTLKKLE